MVKQQTVSELIREYYRGDVHIHSSHHSRITWDRWIKTFDPDEVIDRYARLGFEFMVLVSHSSDPARPKILTKDSPISTFLLRKKKHVHKVLANADCRIMVGVEANILYDSGGHPVIDVPDSVLKQMDLVIASRHAIIDPFTHKMNLRLEKDPDELYNTLCMAITNPHVHLIGHPDRYAKHDHAKRESYWKEYWGVWPQILKLMKKHQVAFEINISSPPDVELVDMAIQEGVLLFISSDAHRTADFRFIELLHTETCQHIITDKSYPEVMSELRPIMNKWSKSRHLSKKHHKESFDLLAQLLFWSYYLRDKKVPVRRVVNSRFQHMKSFLKQYTK